MVTGIRGIEFGFARKNGFQVLGFLGNRDCSPELPSLAPRAGTARGLETLLEEIGFNVLK